MGLTARAGRRAAAEEGHTMLRVSGAEPQIQPLHITLGDVAFEPVQQVIRLGGGPRNTIHMIRKANEEPEEKAEEEKGKGKDEGQAEEKEDEEKEEDKAEEEEKEKTEEKKVKDKEEKEEKKPLLIQS